MARKKGKRTYRRKSFSILNALEALVYASILTEGTAGSSVWEFITGPGDLKGGSTYFTNTAMQHVANGNGGGNGEMTGAGSISISDIATNPSSALSVMAANFQANLLPMAIAGFTTSIGFRVGKRLLRAPISSVNRNILKPALGAGIRL
jgi:hypothetical protein